MAYIRKMARYDIDISGYKSAKTKYSRDYMVQLGVQQSFIREVEMAKKYIRLENNDRLKKDIRLALRWWGFDPDSSDEQKIEAVIKSCLSYFLYDHVEGYDLITGDVDFHSKIGGRNELYE